MKKSVIISTVGTLVLLYTSIAYSQPDRGMGPGMMSDDDRPGMMYERGGYGYGMGAYGGRHMYEGCFSHEDILAELDLSEEQSEKIRKEESKFRKEQIRLRAAMKVAKIEYSDMLHEDKVDMKAVEKKVKEIADLKAQSMMNSAKASSVMRGVLSEEQRSKMKVLIREKKQNCPSMGGWGDKD